MISELNRKMWGSVILVAGTIALTACGGNGSGGSSSTADTSVSGSVGAAIGGAYNGSTAGGAMASNNMWGVRGARVLSWLNPISVAHASTACPAFTASTCSTSPTTLAYNECNFGSSTAVWNGGVTFTCSGLIVNRAVTNGTTRTGANEIVITVDSSNLTTYATSTLPGGGTTYDPTGLTITINGIQLVASRGESTLFDHTIISGNSTVVAAGGSAPLTISGDTITGTVTTYHNLVSATAQSTVNVTMSSSCCTPVSGTISSTFTAAMGSVYNGAQETLEYLQCGQAKYTGPEGNSGTVATTVCD